MGKKVKFHLPGLRYNYPINMLLINMMKQFPEYFREDIEIASFFGEFPTSLWNGGRFSNGDQCDANFIRHVVKTINDQGIPIRYTFTNPLITEKDLNDEYCNFCMEVANNGMNEVLVFSPILENYIREKYPNYKINSSTCKEIRDMKALNEELEKDYYLVVLDYNFNNQFDLLEQIKDKERCEVLVNACCKPNCPHRGEHYRTIAREQEATLKNRLLPPNKQVTVPGWTCPYSAGSTSIHDIVDYPTYVSPEAIWEKYVPMGFNNFKLEGRTANIFNIIDTYCLYLMKPERRDAGRFMLTRQLQANNIITVNKPRPAAFKKN